MIYYVALAVDCGRPEDADDNGDVSYDGTTLGSIARYTCNKGYVLVGSKIAQCLYTGQWSYGAPKCRRKFHKNQIVEYHSMLL